MGNTGTVSEMPRAASISLVLADGDRTTRAFLGKALQRAGYVVHEVDSGEAAVEIFEADPRIRFLVANDDLLVDDDLASRVRSGGRPLYVVAMTREQSRDATLAALDAGADDTISRPVDHMELVGRLKTGVRTLAQMSPRHVMDALTDAMEAGHTGELTVRAGDTFGRVHIVEGRIAWVHLGSEPVSLPELVGPDVDESDLRAVVEDCRRTGRNFAEVLVEWDVVDAAALRASMGRWLARRVRALSELRRAETVFVPGAQRYPEAFTYSVDDLDLERGPASSRPPVTDTDFDVSLDGITGLWSTPDWLEDLHLRVAGAMGLAGVKGAAILHAPTGQTLALDGEPLDRDFLGAMLRAWGAAPSADPLDSLWMTGQRGAHALIDLPRHTGCLLAVAIDRAEGSTRLVDDLTAVARR